MSGRPDTYLKKKNIILFPFNLLLDVEGERNFLLKASGPITCNSTGHSLKKTFLELLSTT